MRTLLGFIGFLCLSCAVHAQPASRMITGEDEAVERWFGRSFEVDGTTAVIGTYRELPGGERDGVVCVFDLETGRQLSRLTPTDGPNDGFGASVAISGDTVVVGDTASVYVFDLNTGDQRFKLLPDDPAPGQGFGRSVALSGNSILIGAEDDETLGDYVGAAYLFDAVSGAQLAKLYPADPELARFFGDDVAIEGNTAVVGARKSIRSASDPSSFRSRGAVYVFDVNTATQTRKLIPDEITVLQTIDFGASVAIDDGKILVGAPGEPEPGAALAGTAYLFDAATGAFLHKFINPETEIELAGIDFGISVDLDDSHAVIGMHENGTKQIPGRVYLYDLASGQLDSTINPAEVGLYNRFGEAAKVHGSLALVSAVSDLANGKGPAGAVFVHDLSSGEQLLKLIDPEGPGYDRLGTSVDLNGPRLLIGSPGECVLGPDSGSAALYDSATGSLVHTLLPDDLAPSDQFGFAVALDGPAALVGAPADRFSPDRSGVVYLFDAETGELQHRLVGTDTHPGDRFGISVAVHGTTGVVGAPFDDAAGTDAGAVYLFDSDTGTLQHKLIAEDAMPGDRFGRAVAIHGSLVAVGAPFDDIDDANPADQRSGAVYLFDSQTGQQLAKLVASDGSKFDAFGSAVAIHGTQIAIGAPLDDVGNRVDRGSAYLFDATTGQQQYKYYVPLIIADMQFGASIDLSARSTIIGSPGTNRNLPDDGEAYWFDTATGERTGYYTNYADAPQAAVGSAVAIDGLNIAIGAPLEHSNATEAGTVVLLHTCPADLNNDTILDLGDISAFVLYFLDGNLLADTNGDGLLDQGDIQTFVAAFLAGC